MSYDVARRDLLLNVEHKQNRYLNNRAENSHRPTWRRQMQRFKSSEQAQTFLAAHAFIHDHFHPRRHQMQPLPTARSGLIHSTTGGGRHVPGDEMMRASQPCGVPRRLTWINVTMPYYRVADEIPPVFRQAAQLADRPARENPAEVMAESIKGAAVGEVERTDRVEMQHADVIGFEKCIDGQFPVNPPLQYSRFIMVEGVETVGCKVDR